MQVKVTNKDFGYTTKYLKKNGYTFNGATKTWIGDKDVSFLTDEGYVVAVAPKSDEQLLYADMMNNEDSSN